MIFYCRIKYEGVCRYIWRSFTKKKNMSQYRIISFVKELSVSFINCAQEGASLISKVSPSKLHEQNGFRVSWKLCLNLCSRKCLRLRRSLVRYLVILQLWQLNTLFGDDLTGSVLKVTIVALRKMREATIVAWRVLLIQTRLSC